MVSSLKSILLPTDFSECSKNALNYAAVIAKKTGAGITLLHVIEPPYNFPTKVENALDHLKENATRHLKQMVKDVKSTESGKGLKIETKILTGMTESVILEFIDDLNADLVVLGSRGDTATRKVLFGSVSTDILLKSSVPVIAVPDEVTKPNLKHILFATDFRPGDLDSLKDVMSLADQFESTVRVIHVTECQDFDTEIKFRGFRSLVKDKFNKEKIKFDLVPHEDTYLGISETISSSSATLLVMTRYKKSILGALFDKNYTKKLSIYSEIPILVMAGNRKAVLNE